MTMIRSRDHLDAGADLYIQDCIRDLAGLTSRSDKDKLDNVVVISNYCVVMRGNAGVDADDTDVLKYEG